MATDLDNALVRITEMQKAAVSGSDAVPVFFYTQEGTPFWINKVNGFRAERESSEIQVLFYDVLMRLVLGPMTAGYDKQAEETALSWLPVIPQYFGQRKQLKRTVADAAIAYLHPIGTIIHNGQIDYGMQVTGLGQPMFGIDFHLEVPMWQDVHQVIF